MPAGARVHWDLGKLGWLRSPGLAGSRFPGGCRYPGRVSPGGPERPGRRPDPRALGRGRGSWGPWARCSPATDLAEAGSAGRSCLAPGGPQGSRGPGRPGRAPRAPAVRLGAGTRSRPPRAATSRMGPRCSPGQSGLLPLAAIFLGGYLRGSLAASSLALLSGLLSLKTPLKHEREARLGTLQRRRKPMGNGSSFAIALILELPKSCILCFQPDRQHGKCNSAFLCVCFKISPT